MGLISKATGADTRRARAWDAEVERYKQDLSEAVAADDILAIERAQERGVALAIRQHGRKHIVTLRRRAFLANQQVRMERPVIPVLVGALLADCRAALGDRHVLTLEIRLMTAHVAMIGGRFAEAELEYLSVADDAASAHGPDSPLVRDARLGWTAALDGLGRYRDVVDVVGEILGAAAAPSDRVAGARRSCFINRAYALYRLGDPERALADIAEVEAMDEARRRSGSPRGPMRCAEPQINKALIELALGRAEDAERTVRAAADAVAATRGIDPGHAVLVEARTVLARCLLALGRAEEAYPIADRECRSGAARLGAGHPEVLDARFVRAECLRALGRDDVASAEHKAVLGERRRFLGPDHPDTLVSAEAAA